MEDVWNRIAPLLRGVEQPSRYVNHEFGCTYKEGSDFNFCMVYPDTYEIGQANQALRILINRVNEQRGMFAQRSFLPGGDMAELLRKEHIPLFSLETTSALRSFDAIGITLPHELAATNVLEILDLSGIPVKACMRKEGDPLVIGGGPCALNPEPYAVFFDAFNVGEGELSLPEGLGLIRKLSQQGENREAILYALSQLESWYIPSLYEELSEEEAQVRGSWLCPKKEGVPSVVQKALYKGFSESSGMEPCIVPFVDTVHNRLNVEILRGCARGCRFCQAGMMYRPVRERSEENISASVEEGLQLTGYEEVSLTSLSSTDHSQIEKILLSLNAQVKNKGVRISIPSQRLDSFGIQMAYLVAGQKKGGLTFAPEAGTQRMRDVINKNVTEENLMNATRAALKAGWRRIKLYFMIGLPGESDEDVAAIGSLSSAVYKTMREEVSKEERSQLKLSISCALFVPKSHTPFQWDGQISIEEAARRIGLVRENLRFRAIDLSWHDARSSFIEAAMSRGGRSMGEVVYSAWKKGAIMDAWSEHFSLETWLEAAKESNCNLYKIAQNRYESDYVLPWSFVSCGVKTSWLACERKKAQLGQVTPDCTFGNCSACGACGELSCENQLAEARVIRVADGGKE